MIHGWHEYTPGIFRPRGLVVLRSGEAGSCLEARLYAPGRYCSGHWHAQVHHLEMREEEAETMRPLAGGRWTRLAFGAMDTTLLEKDFGRWEAAEEACRAALVRALAAAPGL